jgi:glycosyltransferase involved in cell wall biosynthesis
LNAVSVIIPAYNEEKYMRPGVAALKAEIARACAERPGLHVEVIVVDNESRDRTAEIAREAGFRVVTESKHQISRVRNTGAQAAGGQVFVTIDADSQIGEGTLSEILDVLAQGAVGGGCARIRLDDQSGLRWVDVAAIRFIINKLMGLGAGIYFCRRADFEAIGGFDETLYAAEDVDFAARLKQHGRKTQRPFVNLSKSILVTSARKFDLVGRRNFLKIILKSCWRPRAAIRSRKIWNRVFYDVDRLR